MRPPSSTESSLTGSPFCPRTDRAGSRRGVDDCLSRQGDPAAGHTASSAPPFAPQVQPHPATSRPFRPSLSPAPRPQPPHPLRTSNLRSIVKPAKRSAAAHQSAPLARPPLAYAGAPRSIHALSPRASSSAPRRPAWVASLRKEPAMPTAVAALDTRSAPRWSASSRSQSGSVCALAPDPYVPPHAMACPARSIPHRARRRPARNLRHVAACLDACFSASICPIHCPSANRLSGLTPPNRWATLSLPDSEGQRRHACRATCLAPRKRSPA
jgi:hypothetical protein